MNKNADFRRSFVTGATGAGALAVPVVLQAATRRRTTGQKVSGE